MTLNLTPRQAQLLLWAIETELHEEGNKSANTSGMGDDEAEVQIVEWIKVENEYRDLVAMLSVESEVMA